MITLIALSRLIAMEAKQENQKERNNNESINSPQKNSNPATSHRISARCFRHVNGRDGACNTRLRPWQPNARSGPLSVWLAELDVQRVSDQYGWFLKTNVKGDSDVYVVRNTWPVGAHSGWHTHPGPSLITILSGELTVYDADDPACTPMVYHAGESFTDVGCGDVHLIRNEGTVCAVNMVVQIVPAGQPRRIDADQPLNCVVPTCPAPTPTPCPQ